MARSGGHFPIVIEFVNLRQDVSFPIAISTAIPISISIARMSHYRAKRCEARQSEIRAGSVLAHVTKRIAAITPPRALVVLRFLLNNPQRTVCFWPNYTILFHTYTDTRSAETGEIFGIGPLNFAL